VNHAPLRDHIGIDHPSPSYRVDESREESNDLNLGMAAHADAQLARPSRPAMTVTIVDWSPALRPDLRASMDRARRLRMTQATKPSTTSGAMARRRIAIVGKQLIAHIRDGIEIIRLANRHVEIVYSAYSLEELRRREIPVDAVVLDLYFEDIGRATSTISAIASLYPVLVVSASARRDDMMAAIHAGASGYVSRNASSDAIIEAVETIVTGGFYLSSHVTSLIGADIPPAEPAGPPFTLSQREKEALLYISQGLTQAQTANRMGVSPATVDTYVKRIRRKVGPGNKADLTRQAIRLGYLNPESIHEFDRAAGPCPGRRVPRSVR
jgi:DNA-binding NarL/FixJ family response regulator